jgi:hypothetical protein
MKPPSKGILFFVLALSGVIAVSAAGVGIASLLQDRASWVMFAFEIVVLVAGVLGMLIGRGRFADGPAIGIAAVAGTVLLGSLFGYLGGGRVLFGVDLRPFLYSRAIASLLLGAAAAWIVVSRDLKATLPLLIRGVAFGLPIPLGLIAYWQFRGRMSCISDVAQLGLAIVGFSLLTGLLAASVQFIFRAFEIGARRAEEANAP